jgi:predicted nucleic acid-binding protein
MPVLVDSNVILDLVTKDLSWFEWSRKAFELYAEGGLVANAIVFAELCLSAESAGAVDNLLEQLGVELVDIPKDALYRAAQAHLLYRRRGGSRTSTLPDFFIGAHAEFSELPLLTGMQAASTPFSESKIADTELNSALLAASLPPIPPSACLLHG